MSAARPLVVDWGTSSFRVYRTTADGGLEFRQADAGILSVRNGDFEGVLRREAGDWLRADVPVLLSGMITSRNGWVETPYADVPASLADLAAATVERRLADGTVLRFLPGMCRRVPSPDVMRGEEIQVFGSVGEGADALVVLPGTHSKWVEVRGGRIVSFRTAMTGELFAVLKDHSILGRLAPPDGAFLEAAFARGVSVALEARAGGLLTDLFSARTGVLLGGLPPEAVSGYLSGLLVGHEVREGLAGRPAARPLLVGGGALVARYREAFALAGIAAAEGPAEATVLGFRRLVALAGGLTT